MRVDGVVVQSYGAGVQSRALLHLAIRGVLSKPDLVIFADTMAEPEAVYRAVEEDRVFAEEAGIEFVVVSNGDLSNLGAWGDGVFVPAFTLGGPKRKRGMLMRQCTVRFKVEPINRFLRSRGVKSARILLGITVDEVVRVKVSKAQWLVNEYPLIELGWSRDDCSEFLTSLGLSAVKSACVFCPYRSELGWAKVRENFSDWDAAVRYDEALRNFRPEAGLLFVHPDRVPLREASVPDLSRVIGLFDEDGFGNECEGHCGV
jgi:hypothetical protein